MSLFLGIAILAVAVTLGGLAAVWQDRGKRAMPVVRTFAVVAAASIALLHLLPEAIEEVGFGALAATALGVLVPSLLERIGAKSHDHHHHSGRAPTTALAMGYAAVVAHQVGEGAALASLAQTGALSISIVLAIAAHTVPLSMVVAIRVFEVKQSPHAPQTPPRGIKRATGLALGGIALATAAGATMGNVVGAARFAAISPWILAGVAGILLHALAHDDAPRRPDTFAGRAMDAVAGLAALGLGVLGVDEHQEVPRGLEVTGLVLVAAFIVARSFWTRAPRPSHHH